MSLHSSAIDPKYLPNLPGFRPRPLHSNPQKISCFDIVNGESYLRPQYIPQSQIPADDASVTSIGNTIVTKARKQVLSPKNVILNYSAYFEERVEGSSMPQVRSCNIYFYVENGTIKVVEKPQVNSGVSQGTLVRRTVIARPDGNPYCEDDLRIGNVLGIYGRYYRLFDCDPATRNYMKEVYGVDEVPETQVPEDPYMKSRQALDKTRSDGENDWGKFRSKKNETKIFMEAKLGNGVNNAGREGFIKYGNVTLKFRCCWDDTDHLYGDVNEFTLSYYLADNTIEIVSIPTPNNNNRSRLLKRSRLPKDFHDATGLGARPPTDAFFHFTDFYIGMELEVYGRRLRLVDADALTREFFADQQMPLGESIVPPPPEIVVHEREVPPPTGFGSEEDSLRSVAGSLMPGPPPVKKLGENKQLSFLCSLLSGGIDDVDRRFVLTYHVQDNTLKVVEPPVRNSGFVGGTFLSRRAVKKTGNLHGSVSTASSSAIEYVTDKDLYVGCRLRILMHEFLLLDTADSTLRWMEDKGLPRSNVFAVLDKMRPQLLADARNGSLLSKFEFYERQMDNSDAAAGHGPGRVTRNELREVLKEYGLINPIDPRAVSEHELITIQRAQGNKLPTFEYEKFIQQIVQPTADYK
jgi:hypothetical protein